MSKYIDLRENYSKGLLKEASKYINDGGKILPRRFTGTCAKHQRHVAEQVKLARFMGFIPYTTK